MAQQKAMESTPGHRYGTRAAERKRKLEEAPTPPKTEKPRRRLTIDSGSSSKAPRQQDEAQQDAVALPCELDFVDSFADDGQIEADVESDDLEEDGGLEAALEQVIDEDSDEDAEERFVPGPRADEVRFDFCMARIWGDGSGRQCQRRPGCGDLCRIHEDKPLKHGRVTGPVPEEKLREMEELWAGGARSRTFELRSRKIETPTPDVSRTPAVGSRASPPIVNEPPRKTFNRDSGSARHVNTSPSLASTRSLRSHSAASPPLASPQASRHRASPQASPQTPPPPQASPRRKAESSTLQALPARTVSTTPAGGSPCEDFNWLSDGEEEMRPARSMTFRAKLSGSSMRRQRCFHNRVQLEQGRGQLAEVKVGDVVRVSNARRGATEVTGEICQLFEDGGQKMMTLRRMLGAHELRQRSASSGSVLAITDEELVETDECLELPLSKTIKVLRVLSEKDFSDWCDDEEISVASLGDINRPYLCRRSLAPSGLLWQISWDETARESRRDACVRALQSTESQEPPPPLRPVPSGPAGSQELFARAAAALRAGAASGMLPGRDNEQEQVMSFLRDAIRSGGRKEVLYVSGMPGTGKTASVLEAVRRLQSRNSLSFEFAHVNAMCLSTPGAVFAEICRKIPSATAGQRKLRREGSQENQAQAALSRFFTSGGSRSKVVVLLIDEVDALVTQAQSVLYRLFDWLTRPGARLAVVAIANTMDLPERLLPRVASRLGMLRLNFQPYNRAQLKTILADRLRAGHAEGSFREDALLLCAARVAAGSGDARKSLQVCRRAIESQAAAVAEGRRAPGPVTANEMTQAEADLLRANPAAMAVQGFGEKARRLLLAMVLALRSQPSSSALPLEALIRRYKGIMNLSEQREVEDSTADHQRHVDDVHFLLRRLQAMSILSPLMTSKCDTKASGEAPEMTLELGESLDVDDVADSLSSVEGDDVAKELLGFVAPPMPLKKLN